MLAPNFRLPRLDGGPLALAEYHGRRVLLVFSDPGCGPCEQLAPHLERLHRERADLQVLMISRQDREANRQKVAKLGLTFPVVLQQNWEVSRLYAMFSTPFRLGDQIVRIISAEQLPQLPQRISGVLGFRVLATP